MNKLTIDDFFQCYNKNLSFYLYNQGIRYITTCINPKTNKYYSLYQKSDELSNAIIEYKKLVNE